MEEKKVVQHTPRNKTDVIPMKTISIGTVRHSHRTPKRLVLIRKKTRKRLRINPFTEQTSTIVNDTG